MVQLDDDLQMMHKEYREPCTLLREPNHQLDNYLSKRN